MLLIRRRREETLRNIRDVEEKYGYISTSSFKFQELIIFELPEDILIQIFKFLGPTALLLNMKYYSIYIESRGLKITDKKFLSEDFDKSINPFVSTIDLYMPKNNTGFAINVYKPINLKILRNLENINIYALLNLATLEHIRGYISPVLDNIKRININYYSDREQFDVNYLRELETKRKDVSLLDKILSKLHIIDRSKSVRFSFKEYISDIFNRIGCYTVSDIAKLYDSEVYQEYKQLTFYMHYHPLDVHYFNTVCKELFAKKNIDITLETVGAVYRSSDYNPIN